MKNNKSVRKSTTKKLIKKAIKKLTANRHDLLLSCVKKYRALLKLRKYKGRAKARLAPFVAEYRLHVAQGEFAR